MTITLTREDLDAFFRDLDGWRFARESAMEKIIRERHGEPEVKEIYASYNDQTQKIAKPTIGGIPLPW